MLSLEFAAVQIIAVDTVQNSGLHKTGYLMNAGHFSKNTVSTGDLNRGRRTESRLLFGSFCRSKKNKLVPFRELPDKQEVCPCRGSMLFGSFCRNKKNVKPFPFGNISPAFKKAGQKRRRTPPHTSTHIACTNAPHFARTIRLLRKLYKAAKPQKYTSGGITDEIYR